ncbi:MAG: N-acetylmuramic acid 6-phosphate etherase [Candidatus Rokubacteria bacterium]|nr:N-acetylmuramic acid 6-phosphate etherase [Candidatus Rokubacteria bacterium]
MKRRARPSRPRPDYVTPPTERPNPRARRLDRLTPLALVAMIAAEDRRAAASVATVRRPLARAVEVVAAALRQEGRLIYVGAGTSGRLGVLDAAECPPTFGVPPGRVVGVIAGGHRALARAVEGAEDRASDGARALARLRVGSRDVVCAICASGVTPFTLAALRAAGRRGARTIAVTCAPSARLAALAEILIAPRVGPEVVAGSTRMKAGLATKMVLHTLTTAAMVRVGKVYGNLMVDVQPVSAKLRARALRIVSALTGLAPAAARALLRRAGGRPKLAVVMHRRGVSATSARRLLRAHGDDLGAALGESARAR